MIEILLEDILTKIHTKNFSEPKQISDELQRLILNERLSEKDISYCSAKLFNSDLNIFVFLDENAQEKEKRLVNLRKELISVLCDFMSLHSGYLINYLTILREDCLKLFKKEITQEVKKMTLKPILLMIELYEPQILRSVIKVTSIADVLLDEI